MSSKTYLHVAHEYLHRPLNKITVNLVGVGGTGTHMLSCLASISHTLKAVGMVPLQVNAFDPDNVEPANVGRQSFAPSEIGLNKAVAAVTRINRYFGTEWRAHPVIYENDGNYRNVEISRNILITCVDNIASRFHMRELFPNSKDLLNKRAFNSVTLPLYWLDIGNDRYTGQIVLGTLLPSKSRRKGHRAMLPTFVEMFPEMKGKKDPAEPSCSTLEAITRQDLFINKLLATLAGDLLWQLLFKKEVQHHGYFVNMTTGKVNPIKIA